MVAKMTEIFFKLTKIIGVGVVEGQGGILP